MWKPVGYLNKPESYFTDIYESTTDTGESSPIWSVRFMEHKPNAHLEVIDGNMTFHETKRTTTRHEYELNSFMTTRVVENTLYFPGWTVTIDGKRSQIQFQDPLYRGLMTFYVPQGKHTLILQFMDTKVRQVSNLLSVIGFVILFIPFTIRIWKRAS